MTTPPATPAALAAAPAPLPALGPTLQAATDRAIARLRAAHPAVEWTADTLARCTRLALASDFAIDVLLRQPELLPALLADEGDAPVTPPHLDADDSIHWPAKLRRFRTAASTRLVWRDLASVDDIDATLAGATGLAQTCLDLALAALEGDFARRYGVVLADDAPHAPVRLVVLAMGKLGGDELNFSSDIDLVYAYASEGTSDGPRPLAAADYFARLGQQLARLLDETTADGFSHRVDLRLRPFGNAGRVALSFAAMEQYFQREGRDWERYAWQKARPVAGDLVAGAAFLDSLRPFIYRRYLDYGALDGLRAMKATIAAEVIRKELADDIKRGPGGIREIEFLAQALQLIRGGPEPALRERRLLPALQALQDAGHLAPDVVAALTDDYRFLRHLENRLQMRRDAQVHALPLDPDERTRIAIALGFGDWAGLCVRLDAHRAHVAAEFEALLAPRRRHLVTGDIAAYWRALPEAGSPDVLAGAGFDHAGDADGALRDFARSPGLRNLSDAARARLDRLMPVLLDASAASARPLLALRRLLALLQNILRRASYLALLDEQPAALLRLVDVVTRSALLSERLAAHPLLLDELLDARGVDAEQSRAALHAACAAAIARGDDSHGREGDSDGAAARRDIEVSLLALNETRQSLSFRTALAALDRTQPATHSTRQLAWLADAVVESVLELATQDMVDAHGALPDARFIVVGYGSLGGSELGFGSDLDLVFLYDAVPDAASNGLRPLDAPRWFARLAQKIVALLSTQSAGGRLYDTDVRLRPDGAKGLLVSSLASYTAYQRERAWTWEHQALVRARVIAGDAGLQADFEAIRTQVLQRQRVPGEVHDEVVAMRARMRAELDRSDDTRFDLKQGQGGLVDLEFLLQWLVLQHAASEPRWLHARDTPGLLDTAETTETWPADIVAALRNAHATLLAAGLDCTLDRRQRIVARTPAIDAARGVIVAASASLGLVFG